MADTTANRDYPFPESTDHTRLWEYFQSLAEAVDEDRQSIDDAWTSYTPVFWTSSGSPSLGAGGVARGRYKKIGRTVHASLYAIFGTSPNFGTGGFFLSAPVAAATVTDMAWNGSAYFRDASGSGSGHYTGYCRIDSAASIISMYQASTQVAAAHPFTWVATDFMRLSLTYESAS